MKQLDTSSEDIIQSQIFRWFHNTYCTKLNPIPNIIFSVPNGGTRNSKEAMKLKATGLISGVSDLIVILPNKVIFVEVKTETGKQSDNQKLFKEKVTNLGFEYLIVRSLSEFQNFILNL